MTANLPRKITVLGLFVLLNGMVFKPLKAQVPARTQTIWQAIPRDIQRTSTAPLTPNVCWFRLALLIRRSLRQPKVGTLFRSD
ncbi:hypothetical protein [Nostoc sp.]